MNDPTPTPHPTPEARAAELEATKARLAVAEAAAAAESARADKAEKDHADTAKRAHLAVKSAGEAVKDAVQLAEAHKIDAAIAKEAITTLRTDAEMRSPKQSAAAGGWDRPTTPHPGFYTDRIRPEHRDALMRHIERNEDMPRGLKGTAKEILDRIRRLQPQKLTPFEAELEPHLYALEARGWRPDPTKPHR